jgi:hypothetical protein
MTNIFDAAHASPPSDTTRARLANGWRIVPRPIAGYSAGPSRSQGQSVLL